MSRAETWLDEANEATARPTAEMSACEGGHHVPIIVGVDLADCRSYVESLRWRKIFGYRAVTLRTDQARGYVGPVYVTPRARQLPPSAMRLRQMTGVRPVYLWHDSIPCGLTCICSREDSERVA